MVLAKRYTPQQSLLKARKYCAYQERCHEEVKTKLYSWGLHKNETEEIMSKLIEENFLNEERFAIAYAGGKFRVKKWGRVKVIQELKQRKISDYCIKQALKEIPEEKYLQTMRILKEKKQIALQSGNEFVQKAKTASYLIGKGYEQELVWALLNKENGK